MYVDIFHWEGAGSDVHPQEIGIHCARLPCPVASASKDKYTTIWSFRGIMLLRMEQVGTKSLPLGKIDLHTFSSMNPDEKGHMEKIMTASQDTVHTVCGLVALCSCSRPELLSMVCCFAGDKCMDTVDMGTSDVKVWIANRWQIERQYGMSPHLAQLCKNVQES